MTGDIERHATTRLKQIVSAPSSPGERPRWTTGAKTGVGTAVSNQSRIWYSISHGVLNEVYFPTIDQANTRNMRFVVTDGSGFFSDEAMNGKHRVSTVESGVPAYEIYTQAPAGEYKIRKKIFSHPERSVVLVEVEFEAPSADLGLYLMLDPHIGDAGADNDAWVGEYKGLPMLFAQRHETALAVHSSCGFLEMTCGFLGKSDGYTDLARNRRLSVCYTEASQGNVSLCGRIPLSGRTTHFCIALGLGGHAAEAAHQVRAALLEPPDYVLRKFVQGWSENQRGYIELAGPGESFCDMYRISTAVLQTHESKRFPGAVVASLSIPWGFDRGDKDIGGYHAIWPRDMAHAAFGKLACGDAESARRTLFYFQSTQEHDGHWPQNMWLDGTAHWTAIQMDGTGFAILLADTLCRARELDHGQAWKMVRQAAGFLVRNGPVTQQDRWESDAGYDPNTMAVETAALLGAADFADIQGECELAEFLRATADAWNDSIDELTYASKGELTQKFGVSGHYIRIAPPSVIRSGLHEETLLKLNNLPADRSIRRAVDVVSPGMLALVRFGLRSPHDPRIRDSLKIVDAILKKNLSSGPVWHRYTADAYGELPDGSPFKKTGQGRGWPLLAAERAQYEIAAGNFDEAKRLLETIRSQTSECGLIPEQVWDAADIPEHELFNGKPTGSGMPLVWAHAEYISVLRSLKERKVWDTPPQPVQRYQIEKRVARFRIWTVQQPRERVVAGKDLRLDLASPARVRWSTDNWRTAQETHTLDTHIGVHYAMLPVGRLGPRERVCFIVYGPDAKEGQGERFEVSVT